MRELFLIAPESTERSLVLAASPNPGEDDERFFLELSDATRATLGLQTAEPPQQEAAEPAPQPGADAGVGKQPPQQPDPRLTAPLTLRPREIQDRVRSGATLSQLAEEMGVLESRLEPYAHPVLQERARFAELAKTSHPMRETGPARLSLLEVLATAFAARGLAADKAAWDAYRDPDHQWVVTVTFLEDGATVTAEWTLQGLTSGSPTATSRNLIATELTDPESVPRRPAVNEDAEEVPRLDNVTPISGGGRLAPAATAQLPPSDEELSAEDGEDSGDPGDEDGLLRSPGADGNEGSSPAKRRRKAVTPHWEDVLLGVRTNTKRPRK